MTIPELTQLITSVSTLAAVLGGLYVSLRNGRKTDANAAKIEEVHKATNGMKDELVRATGVAQRAEGKQEERAEERDRVDAKLNRDS